MGRANKLQSSYIGSADSAILNFNVDVVVARLLWLEVDDLKIVPVLGVVDARLDGS